MEGTKKDRDRWEKWAKRLSDWAIGRFAIAKKSSKHEQRQQSTTDNERERDDHHHPWESRGIGIGIGIFIIAIGSFGFAAESEEEEASDMEGGDGGQRVHAEEELQKVLHLPQAETLRRRRQRWWGSPPSASPLTFGPSKQRLLWWIVESYFLSSCSIQWRVIGFTNLDLWFHNSLGVGRRN